VNGIKAQTGHLVKLKLSLCTSWRWIGEWYNFTHC